MRAWSTVPFAFALVLAPVACSSDEDEGGKTNVMPGDPFGNYDDMGITVIGAGGDSGGGAAGDGAAEPPAGGGSVLVGTPEGDVSEAEVCIDGLCSGTEVDASNWCDREGGPVDLIYVDGVLVETICYPPAEDPERPTEVIDGTMGDVNIVQNANKTTVTFDPSTDGVPIEGNITVDGNNVAIYGNGPDKTIIDGNVELDGNTLRVRGVTITGNLVLRKNRAAIVLCRIEGDVHLETMSTNGSVFAENEIWGNFQSDSNGNVFVSNDVLGNWQHDGNGNTCDDNWHFDDADMDDVIDDPERDTLLTCE